MGENKTCNVRYELPLIPLLLLPEQGTHTHLLLVFSPAAPLPVLGAAVG